MEYIPIGKNSDADQDATFFAGAIPNQEGILEVGGELIGVYVMGDVIMLAATPQPEFVYDSNNGGLRFIGNDAAPDSNRYIIKKVPNGTPSITPYVGNGIPTIFPEIRSRE